MNHKPIIQIPSEDPAVLSRRERKKRNQKFTIIRAAQPLFEEKGYDETSVSEIADALIFPMPLSSIISRQKMTCSGPSHTWNTKIWQKSSISVFLPKTASTRSSTAPSRNGWKTPSKTGKSASAFWRSP